MGTIRVARRPRYTQVDRRMVNDERLSYRARGVLLWLLDKPDDWQTDSESIARGGKEGRDAVRSALTELRTHGYLVQERIRGERGRFVTISTVYEHPSLRADLSMTGDGFSGPGDEGTRAGAPTTGYPTPDDQAIKTEDGEPKTENEGKTAGDAGVAGGATIVDLPPSEAEQLAAAAREITAEHWNGCADRGKPKPAVKFVALAKIVERLLDAGWTRDKVAAALDSCRAYTLDSITFSLTGSPDAKTGAPHQPRGFDAVTEARRRRVAGE